MPQDRELVLREREVAAREREVTAREAEIKRSPWLNPLVLGLFVAGLGLLGNIVVAVVNSQNMQSVERVRAQSTLMLEAIKGGSSETTCKNLVFFVGLGLLDDSTQSIHNRCENTPIGVPSLPVSLLYAPYGSNFSAQNNPIVCVVQDADTGKPIEGASISLPWLLQPLKTDEKGQFGFSRPIFDGSLGNMRIEKEGYVPLNTNYSMIIQTQVFKLNKK